MRSLKQIVKVVITHLDLRATTINTKGNAISMSVDFRRNPEIKRLVDEFSVKLLEALEKEIE